MTRIELKSPFTPHITAYHHDHALALATAAQLAYEEKENATLKAQMQQWGFRDDEYECLSSDDTQALVAANKEIILIAFRGTEQRKLGDWMTNLKGKSTEFNPFYSGWGSVHEGFLNALKVIEQDIDRYLKLAERTQTPIFLTGHSLGGALATLAAAQLKMKKYPVQGLYTFGSPRVGNGEFAQLFDRELGSRTFRFVNDKDIVARVAPERLKYKHVNNRNPIMIGLNELVSQIKEVDDYLNSDHWFNIFAEIGERLWEGITDHDMKAYIQYLGDALKPQTLEHPKLQPRQSVFGNIFKWGAAQYKGGQGSDDQLSRTHTRLKFIEQ